jgi:hypothetical protein
MALVFMDGFDAIDITGKWSMINGSWFADGSTRFSNGRSIKVGSQNNPVTKFIPAASAIYLGVAIKAGAPDGATALIRLLGDSGTTLHLNLRLSGANQLTLYTGNTLLGTYTHGAQLSGLWNHFEIGGTIATAGGTATVKMNGVTVIDYTGNTKGGGTATTFDAISLSGNSFSGTSFDDLYVCDGTGAAPYNTFLGDTRVVTMSPSGAGASTQLTPDSGANYARVNEMPYSAVNNVTGTTPGQRDTYTLTDLPFGVTQIFAVQNNVIAKKTSTGAIAVKPALKSGAGVYYGAAFSSGTTDTTVSDLRTIDPNTSAAWTVGGVNSLEAGLEIA